MDPPSGLGPIDGLLHSSVQHKDSHIQALSLYLLNSFTHLAAPSPTFIAYSMLDTVPAVLGVE